MLAAQGHHAEPGSQRRPHLTLLTIAAPASFLAFFSPFLSLICSCFVFVVFFPPFLVLHYPSHIQTNHGLSVNRGSVHQKSIMSTHP